MSQTQPTQPTTATATATGTSTTVQAGAHAVHRPLAEQVVVITGASSGIGLCTAQLAAERGARVVLVARSVATLETLTERITTGGGQAIYVDADVGDRLQMVDAARAAVARFGRIDTWVNNAGVGILGRLDQVGEVDARRLFDTNFWGVVNGSLAALPFLREHGGALVNVGSALPGRALALQGYHAASKLAVRGFTETLRLEIEHIDQAPVSVTLIEPAAVDTPYARHASNYTDAEARLPEPLAAPEAVAEAILQAATEGGTCVQVGTVTAGPLPTAGQMPASDPRPTLEAHRQQLDSAPHQPEGTLFRPGGEGQVRGTPPP